MRHLLLLSISLASYSLNSQKIVDDYINHWKSFYPGNALQMGFHDSAFGFDDLSKASIEEWVDFNRSVLQNIEDKEVSETHSFEINKRLLKSQAITEIHKWETEKPHQTSLSYYNKMFNQALKRPDNVSFLTRKDLHLVKVKAFQSITNNARHLVTNLHSINDPEPEKSINLLESVISDMKEQQLFYENSSPYQNENNLVMEIETAKNQLANALAHAKSISQNPVTTILGEKEYSRRLSIYTDSDLSPKQLESMTLHEIKVTKQLMKEISITYLRNNYPEKPLPESHDDVIKLALNDMEKDVVSNAQEYLTFWEELAEDASRFIETQEIATLPEYPTLRIMTAPESAGPAARIGWVSSAPPFAPNPVTTLYLPSIPDTLSEQEQIDFWSSFNKPFNRMIVIHELIPGHYMQLKISRETPHKIRLLFPYGPYIEGWATFCEMIALDHGWEKERPFTYLAHLRKRLENANRAYTSVMVHCNGWGKDEVMEFSTDTSLLAPQFAKSLWGRLMRSPMQITSYYYGGALFKNLYEDVKNKMGDQFILKEFMDTIMKEGPIPVEEFYNIFGD